MADILGDGRFAEAQPIIKGWSEDQKYRVKDAGGRWMLLRVSDIAKMDRKKVEYDMMARAYHLGVPTAQPYEFGLCDGGKSCYSLSGWLDGEDAEKILPRKSQEEQYALGLKAGETLRKIHALPLGEEAEDWSARFERKVQSWIAQYDAKAEIHSDMGERIVGYLKERRGVLASRPSTLIHGDYNTENMIVLANGDVCAIDFNSYNTSCGDPWWDLNNMAWMPAMVPPFYTGQMRGYFGGEPPGAFWDVLTYYLAYDALAAWTDPYGLNGIEDGTEIVRNILAWTEHFQNPVPSWYGRGIP